ncbi:hypothetical protein TNCV_1166621 [Trichonephila clavipes]|uniref:Uncharacterized protein n=1 Tax=Trichonephila clavipes TaxID=2585209 RepID=A0A8X6VPE4_TRICX|nr:hypothetical protein TNCV_1166621 [Trichonephila clavipes]
MSLPNPVEQKSHDVINNKLSRVMKEVAEESMKMAAVEEYSSSPDNLLTVSARGTWKTRGHSSLVGVCNSTVIGGRNRKLIGNRPEQQEIINTLKELRSNKQSKVTMKVVTVFQVQLSKSQLPFLNSQSRKKQKTTTGDGPSSSKPSSRTTPALEPPHSPHHANMRTLE